MKTRYAKSTGTFYPFDIAYPSLPADVQVVDQTDYLAAMARPVGSTFDFDADGVLTITPAAPESVQSILDRALIEIRAQRAPILDALGGIAGRTARAGDTDTAAAADKGASDLLNITTLPALLSAATYDDMKAAVMAEYRRIAAAAPASVQTAFREVLGS